jgi:hypothetical protein
VSLYSDFPIVSPCPAMETYTLAPGASSSIRYQKCGPLALVALFVGLMLWRSPDLLTGPRFWGEEGRYYYDALQNGDASPFTLVVRGNFQLIVNLFAYFATLVPARWAAHVTTYLGLLVAMWCVFLFGMFSKENTWSFWKSALVVLALSLIAQGYEIYLSSTNSQWLCALSLLFICLLKWSDSGAVGRGLLYLWVAVCAFSGVPSVVMTPILLLKGIAYRSRLHLRFGIILAAGAIFQAAVICLHPHPARSFSPTGLLLTAPWLFQTVASPLITAEGTERLITFLRMHRDVYGVCATFLALASIAAFLVISGFRKAKDQSIPVVLVSAWVFVPTIQIFGVLGDPNGLISGWSNGRYFFLGAFCFVLLAGLVAHSDKAGPRWSATLLLCIMTFSGIYQVHSGSWKNFMLHGPAFNADVAKCGERRPCEVQAWPGGPDWAFELYRR